MSIDGTVLQKETEGISFTVAGGQKQEKLHILTVTENGTPIKEEQKIQLKVHGKTQGDKAREEDKYLDITIKPKLLYWNAYTNTDNVELNVDNASFDLFMENYQQDNITKHSINYEITLENKETNPYMVTIDGVDLTTSSYTSSIAGENKAQEKKTITIQKQDGKPVATNEQITLKFKINDPLPAEKTFTIAVKQYWLIDYSGNGYHAKLKNGAEIVKDTEGYALKLDGVDDYVEIPVLSASHDWKEGVDIEGSFKTSVLNSEPSTILALSNTGPTDDEWQDHIDVRVYASEPKIYFEAMGHGALGDVIFANGTEKESFALGKKQTFKVDMFKRAGFYAPIYINGSKASGDGQLLTTLYPIPNVERRYNYIGRSPWGGSLFNGYIYDLAIRSDDASDNIFYYNLNR